MPNRTEMWRTVRLAIVTAAILGGIHAFAVRPIERALVSTRSGLRHGLEEVLAAVTKGSTRTVEGRAEIIGTTEIAELPLLQMRLSTTRAIEKSEMMMMLPLGTKKLIVRGVYDVKGGYKLTDGVSLRMEGGEPVARFPKPEILSVELVDLEVLSEDNGWLNKIQAGDREQILRELRIQMRQEAARSGMLDTVSTTLGHRLGNLLGVETVRIEQEIP